jgi:hypothetical protein
MFLTTVSLAAIIATSATVGGGVAIIIHKKLQDDRIPQCSDTFMGFRCDDEDFPSFHQVSSIRFFDVE